MLLKILFWLFVAIDVVGLGLLFVLGLAAAGSAKTHPLEVVLVMLVVPGLVLAAAVLLFLQTQWTGWRLLALLVVSGPTLVLAIGRITSEIAVRQQAVGILGSTPLTRALRELERDPGQLATVRTLLAQGAEVGHGEEQPLVLAIYAARHVGLAPTQLLLDAGADANAANAFGSPAWFAATGATVDTKVLALLIDRGADLQATERDGRGAVWSAVNTWNWSAALLLLRRGASSDGLSPMGLSLRETLEEHVRRHGEQGGVSEVLAVVRGRGK